MLFDVIVTEKIRVVSFPLGEKMLLCLAELLTEVANQSLISGENQ